MNIRWLGHATFMISSDDGIRIITDPYTTGGKLSYGEIREPTCSIGAGSVNFCRILPRESTATVAGIAAVGINDNFSACQAAVTMRTADDKSTGRIDVENSVFVHQPFWHDRFDYVVNDLLSQFIVLY